MRRSEMVETESDRSDGDELGPGDTITIAWGREALSPIRYNSFEVGPFTATTTIREGETADDARARALRFLERTAKELYERKLEGHLARVRHAVEQTKRAGSRG